jgi:hypothetical protein
MDQMETQLLPQSLDFTNIPDSLPLDQYDVLPPLHRTSAPPDRSAGPDTEKVAAKMDRQGMVMDVENGDHGELAEPGVGKGDATPPHMVSSPLEAEKGDEVPCGQANIAVSPEKEPGFKNKF